MSYIGNLTGDLLRFGQLAILVAVWIESDQCLVNAHDCADHDADSTRLTESPEGNGT